MQKTSLILLLVIKALITVTGYTQSFEVNIVAPHRIEPSNGIETVDGDYIVLFNSWVVSPVPLHPIIIRIDPVGNIINHITVDFYDFMTLTSIFYDAEEEAYIIIGAVGSAPDFIADSLIISSWTTDLDLMSFTVLESPFNTYTFVSAALLNNSGQIVLTGYTIPDAGYYGFVYLLDEEFLIINQHIFNFPCRTNSIVEYHSDGCSGYIITMNGKPEGVSTGEYLIKTDNLLNVLYYYPTNTIFGMGITCITSFDSLFILTGKHFLFVPPNNAERDVAVEIIDHNNILIASSVFGKSKDTIDFPGVFSGAAVVDANNIFVPGTSNFNIAQYPYATTPSWLMLNKVDGDLNLQWQKFYGGDAHYVLYGIIPSSDGGCVMLGTRFHPDNPTGIDGYILKVGPDGLVSVPEVPGGLQVKEVIVFPNPGSTHLNIQTGHENLEIRFYSSAGSLHHFEKINRFNHTITTTSWPAGVYIYQIYKNESLLDNGKWIKAE
jgi:hypothetical protein